MHSLNDRVNTLWAHLLYITPLSVSDAKPTNPPLLLWCNRAMLTLQHVMVSVISDGEDVGWHLISPLALVHVNDLLGIDGQSLVGIHSHTEKSRVGL